MSLLLRIEMIVLALAMVTIITVSINKKKLRVQYSFVWILVAVMLLAGAFFPGLVVWLCGVTGIQTPSNLVYLLGIIVLFLISFYQTFLLSKQSDRIIRLIQLMSLERFFAEERDERSDGKERTD